MSLNHTTIYSNCSYWPNVQIKATSMLCWFSNGRSAANGIDNTFQSTKKYIARNPDPRQTYSLNAQSNRNPTHIAIPSLVHRSKPEIHPICRTHMHASRQQDIPITTISAGRHPSYHPGPASVSPPLSVSSSQPCRASSVSVSYPPSWTLRSPSPCRPAKTAC